MTTSFNNISPRVRRFARFANAFYQVGTAEHAARLLTYGQQLDSPGFGSFYALAKSILQEHDQYVPHTGAMPQRLPGPGLGDNTRLRAQTRHALHAALAAVADDAYNRHDISAIARGEYAQDLALVYKRGRTVFDMHGRPICRVLMDGADERVYSAILACWTDSAPPAKPVVDPDDFL